jgi:hypothetical protein
MQEVVIWLIPRAASLVVMVTRFGESGNWYGSCKLGLERSGCKGYSELCVTGRWELAGRYWRAGQG